MYICLQALTNLLSGNPYPRVAFNAVLLLSMLVQKLPYTGTLVYVEERRLELLNNKKLMGQLLGFSIRHISERPVKEDVFCDLGAAAVSAKCFFTKLMGKEITELKPVIAELA